MSAMHAVDDHLEPAPWYSGRRTLTVTETAELVGIGRNAAYEAIKRGEIPALHFGSRIVVPLAPLLRLLGIEDASAHDQAARRPHAPNSPASERHLTPGSDTESAAATSSKD